MSRLAYVGPTPTDNADIANRLQATAVLQSGPVNHTGVASEIHTTATTTYASKSYIDNADAAFVLPTYYQTQDALNLPLTEIGQPSGVAALDGSGLVPLAQMPVIGAGYLSGPYGPTSSIGGTVTSAGGTPGKIADFAPTWWAGDTAFLAYACVLATGGTPVIEARVSSGVAAYGSQTLIARGVGFASTTQQAVGMAPVPDALSEVAGDYPDPSTAVVSLWVYDQGGQSTSVDPSGIVSAVVYLLRSAL